jgi:hypothetical protein
LQALAVIEYLLANGSERAVDDIIDNSSQIAVCVTSLFFVELSLFRLHSACPRLMPISLWVEIYKFRVCGTEWKRHWAQCAEEG